MGATEIGIMVGAMVGANVEGAAVGLVVILIPLPSSIFLRIVGTSVGCKLTEGAILTLGDILSVGYGVPVG